MKVFIYHHWYQVNNKIIFKKNNKYTYTIKFLYNKISHMAIGNRILTT